MSDNEFSERITTRISPRALREIEALAVLRRASVSSTVRSMIDFYLADDQGKAATAETLRRILKRRPIRARRASHFRPDTPD